MIDPRPPTRTTTKPFWRTHALGALVAVASLTPLATQSGCSTPGTCTVGLAECGGVCTDTMVDPGNCGSCGTVCTGRLTCQAGVCVASSSGCPEGQEMCGGVCRGVMDDPANCGAWDAACDTANPFCSQGACTAACGSGEMAGG